MTRGKSLSFSVSLSRSNFISPASSAGVRLLENLVLLRLRVKKRLQINIGFQGVILNKLTARLDHIAHQAGEHAIGLNRILN